MVKVEGGSDGEFRAKESSTARNINIPGINKGESSLAGSIQGDTVTEADGVSAHSLPRTNKDTPPNNPLLPSPAVADGGSGMRGIEKNGWLTNNFATLLILLREWLSEQTKARLEEAEYQSKLTLAGAATVQAKAQSTREIGRLTLIQSIVSAAANVVTGVGTLYTARQTIKADSQARREFDEQTIKMENNPLYGKGKAQESYNKFMDNESKYKQAEKRSQILKDEIDQLEKNPGSANTSLKNKLLDDPNPRRSESLKDEMSEINPAQGGDPNPSNEKVIKLAKKELEENQEAIEHFQKDMDKYLPGVKNLEKLLGDDFNPKDATPKQLEMHERKEQTEKLLAKRPGIRDETINKNAQKIIVTNNAIVQAITSFGNAVDAVSKGAFESLKSVVDARKQLEEEITRLSMVGRDAAQTSSGQFGEDVKNTVDWFMRLSEAQTRISNISNR